MGKNQNNIIKITHTHCCCQIAIVRVDIPAGRVFYNSMMNVGETIYGEGSYHRRFNRRTSGGL